jgi:CDP-Glycerol:Poly(glycerophosphate) glycerophosphotransferase
MSALGSSLAIILAKVRGRRLARAMAAERPTTTPVAVYFADGPQTMYQLRRWYRVLEALSAEHATTIITSDPSTYAIVRRETTVAVTFATGAPQLARVLDARGIRVILYPNHNALNFRVLRFATPVHVFIGHGESGKESSVSRQLKAYDLDFVADRASINPLRGIRGYDADANAIVVGSPWLGFLGSPPASWQPDDRTVVLYAPTWEGDRPSMHYSSVESLGESIVTAVLDSPGLRLIYRPHPWLGRVRPASAAMDARLRRAIAAADRGDVVDTGEYGWALGAADVCVTDVSSVAHDIRALGKRLLLTVPASPSVPPTPETTFAGAIRIDAQNVARIGELLEQALATTADSVPAPSVSMDALVAAIAAALELTD